MALLLEQNETLAQMGLSIEPFGQGAVAVQSVPALLGHVDVLRLVLDIVDELSDGGTQQSLQAQLDAILSRVACHGSVRTGRRMQAEEMNATAARNGSYPALRPMQPRSPHLCQFGDDRY